MSLKDEETKLKVVELAKNGYNKTEVANILGIPSRTVIDFLNRETWTGWWESFDKYSPKADCLSKLGVYQGPKILTIDVELSPTKGAFWGLFKQNIGLNQIEKDWYILSYAAKWSHEDQVLYKDKRDSWDDEDDSELVEDIWQLLDEADIVVGQNSRRFDVKKINTRCLFWGHKPYSSFKQVDTLEIAKRSFGFTSNKLEYMTDRYCKKYKKLKHGKFPGYELWAQCLVGNQEAWQEMQDYNLNDTLSTEELYTILRPWDNKHPNMSLYGDNYETTCVCGNTNFHHTGYAYTGVSKFNKFACSSCGHEYRDRVNLIPKEKRQNIKSNVS